MSEKYQTLHNAVFNTLSRVFSILVGFIFMPYIVHKLGTEAYGVYLLIFAVLGYFALLDLDLGQAIIKYVAEYKAENSVEKINNVVGATLFIYLVLGLGGGLIIFGLSDLITTRFLKIQESLLPAAQFTFYVASFGFVLTMLLSAFSSVPKALNRYDIPGKVTMIVSLCSTLAVVFLLYLGYGLEEIVVLNVGVSLMSLFIYMIINRRLLPQLSYFPSFDRLTIRKVLSFGLFSSLGRISYILQFQLDRILTGAILGASFVTYYFVPFNLSSKAVTLTSQLSGVILPVVSGLQGRRDFESLIGLYLQASRLIVAIASAVCLPLLVFGNRFLTLWMGTEFAQHSGLVMVLVTLALYADAFTNVPSFVLQGLGYPKVTGTFAMANAVVNVALLYPLAINYGVNGIALAFLISSAAIAPLFIYYANNRILHISLKRLIRDAYLPPLFSAIMIILPLLFIPQAQITNIFVVIGMMIATSTAYLIFCAVIGVFTRDEIKQCIEYLSKRKF